MLVPGMCDLCIDSPSGTSPLHILQFVQKPQVNTTNCTIVLEYRERMGLNPCCCVSARFGARVIGILQILGSVRGIVSTINTQIMVQELKSNENPDNRKELFAQLSFQYPAFNTLDDIIWFIQMYEAYILASNVISLITGSLLVHGIRKEKGKLVLAHLLVHSILLVLSIFTFVLTNIYSGAEVSSLFIGLLVTLYLVGVYLLIVVYAAYLDIQNPAVAYANA